MLIKTSASSPRQRRNLPLRSRRFLPLLLIICGLACLLVVVYPSISFFLISFILPDRELIYPSDSSSFPAPIVIGSSAPSDQFSQASDWFIKTLPLPPPIIAPVDFFSLTIPHLGMVDIPIEINGSNLKKNAIHYPGTSLPGEFGNIVIFGHSALPQFFRPGNPLTIFNPLLDARLDQLINLKYAGVEYSYKIVRITQVEADQIEVMAQNYGLRELTLITCVPLGTYWHRLVVRAELVK